MLKDLAIFQSYYNLDRHAALALPHWEWNSLIKNYHALKAEDRMHQLYSSALGFGGGEAFKDYQNNLESLITHNIQGKNFLTAKGKEFQELESYGDEQSGKHLEAFLGSLGV